MSKDQRAAINQMLCRPQRASQPSIEELRVGFATIMAAMKVSETRTTGVTLADRPALLLEPAVLAE